MALAPFCDRLRRRLRHCAFRFPCLLRHFRAFIVPRCLSNLPEDPGGPAADCRAQHTYRLPGIKIRNVPEILRLKIAVRVLGASAEQTVGDTGGCCLPESDPDVVFIIIGKKTARNDVADLPAVVLPVLLCQSFCCRKDLVLQAVPPCRNAKGFFQCLHDHFPVFVLHLPELHRS